MKTKALIFAMIIWTFSVCPLIYGNINTGHQHEKPVARYSNGYLVFGAFEILFTNPAYSCYGFVATGNYEARSCSLCKKTYYSQQFKDKKGKEYLLYANEACHSSNTGYHDNLDIGICIDPPPNQREEFIK